MNLELYNERSKEIHAANVKAGWWTNIATGESILETRPRPEILMLVVTELSEANEGIVFQKMDDKLPHREMLEVEIADAAIRLHDLVGAEGITLTDEHEESVRDFFSEYELALSQQNGDITMTEASHAIIDLVSGAMEGFRKSNTAKFHNYVARALLACYYVADEWTIDIEGVIDEKTAFNKTREDHQISNRLQDDGKKC